MKTITGLLVVMFGFLTSSVIALTMPLVVVGNPGNAGEISGEDGNMGPRICGSVDYLYSIGKYEVTAGQYTEFLNAVAKTDTYGLYNESMWNNNYGCKIQRIGSSYSVASDQANRPVNFVSFWDACRFTNWLTNGQPTGTQNTSTTESGSYTPGSSSRNTGARWVVTSEDEWYKAAYHKNDGVTSNYFDYPTSSDLAPGQNMADMSGNNANYYTAPYTYPIDSGKYTTVAGEFQDSISPYGTFDQGGNLLEINESGLLRGGSFGSEDNSLRASFRYSHMGLGEERETIGFRVALVPEPATASLLGLGLGSLEFFRRRRV
jgi:formylglycine-generating enzyme required for sulfatase activity